MLHQINVDAELYLTRFEGWCQHDSAALVAEFYGYRQRPSDELAGMLIESCNGVANRIRWIDPHIVYHFDMRNFIDEHKWLKTLRGLGG